MDLWQHCLLKLDEESGEIATALLSEDTLSSGCMALSNCEEINLEVNDLEAVIRALNQKFGFNIHCFQSFEHLDLAKEHADKDLFFWLMYTVKACLALSKMSSKCIQFGLQEKHPDLNEDNYMRLCGCIRDLFFGISQLNGFGLGYIIDEQHVNRKLDKIDHYLKYSISLNCVTEKPIDPDLLPIRIFIDEYCYLPKAKIENKKTDAVIALPMNEGTQSE